MKSNGVEVSVVMPCLNEEKAIGLCVEKASRALAQNGIKGEVVVADNGSTDDSVRIAKSLGARVVHEPVLGYGSAYMRGIEAARGKYIVMGDSDNTYDFSELHKFLEPLQNGYDFVMGSRLKGTIFPGAMPWLHRYVGVPILTGILNLLFRTNVSDAHCGMRSFTKEAHEKMRLQTTGMEFASEMIIKAAKAGLKLTEVPIDYYPRVGESKLHSFRDGWRHLRFMLMYSPTYLFLIPGLLSLLTGFTLLLALLRGPVRVVGLFFDIHYMVLGSLLAILGFQTINLGISAKVYARTEHFDTESRIIDTLLRYFNLERGVASGVALCFSGSMIFIYLLHVLWSGAGGFSELLHLREAIMAMTLMVIGVQTIFSSWFLSILHIRRV